MASTANTEKTSCHAMLPNMGESNPLFTMSTGIAESAAEDAVLRDLLLPEMLSREFRVPSGVQLEEARA